MHKDEYAKLSYLSIMVIQEASQRIGETVLDSLVYNVYLIKIGFKRNPLKRVSLKPTSNNNSWGQVLLFSLTLGPNIGRIRWR